MKRRFFYIALIISVVLQVLPPVANAQFYNGSQVSFGKNRVQHQNFNWQYLRAEQYDVYFYPTSKSLAEYVYYKVPDCIAEGKVLEALPLETYKEFSELFDTDLYENIDMKHCVETRISAGGTSVASVEAQIAAVRQSLGGAKEA